MSSNAEDFRGTMAVIQGNFDSQLTSKMMTHPALFEFSNEDKHFPIFNWSVKTYERYIVLNVQSLGIRQ